MFIVKEIYIQSALLNDRDLSEKDYYPTLGIAYAQSMRQILFDFSKVQGLNKQIEEQEDPLTWEQSLISSLEWFSENPEAIVRQYPQVVYENSHVLESVCELADVEPSLKERIDWQNINERLLGNLSPYVIQTLTGLFKTKDYLREGISTNNNSKIPHTTEIGESYIRFFNDKATRLDINIILSNLILSQFGHFRSFLREYTLHN